MAIISVYRLRTNFTHFINCHLHCSGDWCCSSPFFSIPCLCLYLCVYAIRLGLTGSGFVSILLIHKTQFALIWKLFTLPKGTLTSNASAVEYQWMVDFFYFIFFVKTPTCWVWLHQTDLKMVGRLVFSCSACIVVCWHKNKGIRSNAMVFRNLLGNWTTPNTWLTNLSISVSLSVCVRALAAIQMRPQPTKCV